jgi:hypothetical protein
MSAVNKFASGGYSFLPSVFQYSAGVAASPGYEIQRVRFRQPLPLAEGFDFAEQFIRAAERPIRHGNLIGNAFRVNFGDGGYGSCASRSRSFTPLFRPRSRR